jgi:hypothetical protein
VIANDGRPNPGRHSIEDGRITFVFPSAGGITFSLDVPPTLRGDGQ